MNLDKKIATRQSYGEALAELGKEMAEVYDGEDDTNVYAIYDVYKRICNALVANRDELIKTLSVTLVCGYLPKYIDSESTLIHLAFRL